MNPVYFRLSLLALTGLSCALSVAVLGTAAHTLAVFNSQHASNPWWLPLWTDHFDTNGTKGLVGAAASVVAFSAVYLIMSAIPKLDLANRPHMRALVSLGTSVPSAFITLATVVLAHILNHQTPDTDTIQTWTCRFGENPPMTPGVSMPTNQSNADFSALCTESKFALYTTLVVFLLQAIIAGLAVVTWAADMWANHKAKKEWKDGSSMEMSGPGH